MSTSWKNQFPPSEGWIKMDAVLNSSKPMSENEIKKLVSFGKPQDYEWGVVEQYGKKLKVIYRSIKKKNDQDN